jgi:hypothetical protein
MHGCSLIVASLIFFAHHLEKFELCTLEMLLDFQKVEKNLTCCSCLSMRLRTNFQMNDLLPKCVCSDLACSQGVGETDKIINFLGDEILWKRTISQNNG